MQSDRVQGFSGRIYGPSSYLEAGAISRKEITVKIFTATNVPAALRRSVRVSGNWTRRTFLRNVARGKNCKKWNFHQNYSEEQSIRRLRSMGWSGLVQRSASAAEYLHLQHRTRSDSSGAWQQQNTSQPWHVSLKSQVTVICVVSMVNSVECRYCVSPSPYGLKMKRHNDYIIPH